MIKLNKLLIIVAILGSSSFSVGGLDVSSIRFGPGDALEAHNTGHMDDVNSDGFTDLLLHFRTADTGLTPSDTEACIAAQFTAGGTFSACDAVVVVSR